MYEILHLSRMTDRSNNICIMQRLNLLNPFLESSSGSRFTIRYGFNKSGNRSRNFVESEKAVIAV